LVLKGTGLLKFFNEHKNYGFMVSDLDGSDIFFHFDDLAGTNLTREFLRDAKLTYVVRFAFSILAYYGKYNFSKKAVDIELLSIDPVVASTLVTEMGAPLSNNTAFY
jgi:cold shock CspA family protein